MSPGLRYRHHSNLFGAKTFLTQVLGTEELEILACNPTHKSFILAKLSAHIKTEVSTG